MSPEYYDYQIVGHRSHQESEEKIILVKLTVYEENIFCIESQDLPEWLKIGLKSSVSKINIENKNAQQQQQQQEEEEEEEEPEQIPSHNKASSLLTRFDEWVEKLQEFVLNNFVQLERKKNSLEKINYYVSYFYKSSKKSRKRAILTIVRRERNLQLFLVLKNDEFSQNLIENFHLKEKFGHLGSAEMNRRLIIEDNDDFEKSLTLLQDYLPWIIENI